MRAVNPNRDDPPPPPRVNGLYPRDSAASFSSDPATNDATNIRPRPTTRSMNTDDEEAQEVKRSALQNLCNRIVENKLFVIFTTILTIYALTGDDIKLLATPKEADVWFDGIVIVCMVVFLVEIILCSKGKEDYIFGFFFYLDLVSTVTLVMDLSAVNDILSGNSSDDDAAGNLRGGRTARLGARLGRVLRVLRLVRIIKLYKTYQDEATKQKKRKQQREQERRLAQPGEDEWDESELNAEEQEQEETQEQRESNVGKKLSELTTRKTILLILGLLMTLQACKVEQAEAMSDSASYGADEVYTAFQALVASRSPNSSSAGDGVDYQAEFSHSLLKYIYYHNWFARLEPTTYCFGGQELGCPAENLGHLFWIGVSSKQQSLIDQKLSQIALNYSSFQSYEAAQVSALYNGGYLPDATKRLLSSPWGDVCDTETRKKTGVSILKEIPGTLTYSMPCPEGLRNLEMARKYSKLVTDAEYDEVRLEFYFDNRPFSQQTAFRQLMVMLFLLVLLVVWSMMFTYDANKLIVTPVEKMIRNVMSIRDDPLMATKMADKEFKQEEIEKARARRFNKEKVWRLTKDCISCHFSTSKEEPMETLILEKTIIKLGSLLALGFGEAGANIIKHNMRGQETVSINAMVPGTIVQCVIGVCRVRDFSVATEVLQSGINAFVNMIAEIIHGVADEFHGAPNKNNGETFLVVWRVEQEEVCRIKRMAELSIVAFAKILGAVHRSPVLAGYRTHPGLQYRLGTGCRVDVSFGLHAGWAVEGAVGSEFKIDASYLSPHVSVAHNIERITHLYGVSFLAAESVLDICSPSIAAKCRLIDRLKISGSKDPMKMYVVDLDYRDIKPDTSPPLRIHWNTRNRFKARQFLEAEKTAKMDPGMDVAAIFDCDSIIQAMRDRYTIEFFQIFNMGYQNYYQGEWQVAKRILLFTRNLLPGLEDGPSSALLKFMEVPHQFEPPAWWDGVRELGAHEIEAPAARKERRLGTAAAREHLLSADSDVFSS